MLRNCRSVLLFSCLALCTASGAIAEVKVGYVDMKRLLDSAPQTIAARDSLEREFRQRNDDILKQKQELSDLQDRVQREGAFMEQGQKENLDREIRALQRKVQRNQEDFRDELNFRRNKALLEIEQDLNRAVTRIAQEMGYDLLISSPVVYASASVDITDFILGELGQEFSSAVAPANP